MYNPVVRDPFIFVEDHISEDEKSIEIRFYKCKTIMKKLYIQNVCGRSHLSQGRRRRDFSAQLHQVHPLWEIFSYN